MEMLRSSLHYNKPTETKVLNFERFGNKLDVNSCEKLRIYGTFGSGDLGRLNLGPRSWRRGHLDYLWIRHTEAMFNEP